MLAKKGIRMIGWNEILGSDVHNDGGQGAALGKLDGKAIIHFWYGSDKIATKAVEDGHQVVNSTSHMTYMNKGYDKLPLSKSYSFEPVFAGLKPEHQQNVIGLGCQVWTEWIADADKLHRHVFPALPLMRKRAGPGRRTRIFRISRGGCLDMRRFWMP